jgi:hypothetical protein
VTVRITARLLAVLVHSHGTVITMLGELVHRMSRWAATIAAITTLTPAASQAQITVYNSLTAWSTAVVLPGLDTFDDLDTGAGFYTSPLTRTAGAYSYDVSSPEGFYPSGTVADPSISNYFIEDALTFSSFSPNAYAVGGNFYLGNEFGGFVGTGQVQIILTTTAGSNTQTLTNATQTTFLGFTSTDVITSVTVKALRPANEPIFAVTNNFRVAAVPPTVVPEPGSYLLLATGMAGVLIVARRRRATH